MRYRVTLVVEVEAPDAFQAMTTATAAPQQAIREAEKLISSFQQVSQRVTHCEALGMEKVK